MKNFIREIHFNNKEFWRRGNLSSIISSLGLFIIALIFQKLADSYVSNINGVPVGDLLLSNLPTIEIDFFVVQGVLIVTVLALFLFFYKPKYFCFGIKAFSLFIITRSFFISLTHLGASPDILRLDTDSFGFGLYNLLYNTKNDFFFSGHTGMPLLIAMIFWPERGWRYIFMTFSFVMGVNVLLAHIHYSIDVFAAPFMTYGIYSLAVYFFSDDFKYSRRKSPLPAAAGAGEDRA